MINLKEVPSLSGGYLPQDCYVLRCIKESFKLNKSGDPMITLVWEMCSDEYSTPDGPVTIGGMKLFHNMTLAGDALKFVKDFHEKCGLPLDNFDETNPDLSIYHGLVVYATCYSREEKKFQPLSDDDKAAGKKQGDPIRDVNGDQIINYNPTIKSFEGLCSEETIAALPVF